MPEETTGIVRCNRIKRGADGGVERVLGPSSDLAEFRFDLAESRLDRREVGRVGREVDQEAVARFDGRADLGVVVDAEVIEGDDLTRAQSRTEDVFDEHPKSQLVNGSDQAESGLDPLGREGGDERGGRAVVAGDRADGPLTLWGARVEAGHREGRACLIHRDEVSRIEVEGQIQGEGGTQRLVALGCPQCLFFRLSFSLRMSRPIAQGLRRTWWDSSHSWACSVKVASA